MKLNVAGLVLFGISAAAPFVVAQNPATSVNVDASANRHAINPAIYGVAYADAHDMAALNATLNRWGGNSTTRYNWQIDAHSAAADWYFETYSDGSGTPSGSADDFVTATRGGSSAAEPLFTIPMIDYIANLGAGRSTLAGFSVKKYGAQTGTDPWNSDAGNGVSAATGKNITGNNPLDTGVVNTAALQQAWVQHFVSKYGGAGAAGGIKYYILDNEPSIWYSTHRDVHPSPTTYDELFNKMVTYATAIRAADPKAKILGPEEWSWWAMYFSGFDQANGWSASNSDYNTHGQMYYYPWLLKKIKDYQTTSGVRLIDVLTVHPYNGTPGGGDDSPSAQQLRNKETRILWDPTYSDPSWYGDIGINGRVLNWIPTMKKMIADYCPGLELGFTEYNWGDEANLNGATTQADVLGIYGREGVDLATRWTVAKNDQTTPTTYYVTYLASQIYRNYDGQDATFGDTSVAASVANPDNLSAFASVRSSDGALTVMVINKQTGSTPVTVSLANFASSGSAQVWQINSASQTSIAHLADLAVASNSLTTTVPSQSITLFVVPSGSVISPPTAPTGLAAQVGNGSVTLTWNAGGGATSYVLKRALTSGGPYTTLGTVTSPSPTTFTDTGLTNGNTYYYVVAGSNSAGTSPNSAEVAATPILPPSFGSSASASPNPVNQGTSTTVTATVTDTANSLTNGNVQLTVLDPGGATVATQNFSGQSFALNQSRNYTLAFTPASAGTFTVKIGVYSQTWQLWHWNDAAASITVNSNLSFSSSATATPGTVAPGASVSIAFTVTDTGTATLSNANVEMQVFDSSGNNPVTNVWSGQNFTGGSSHNYTYTWNVASNQATGNYTVMIGVFDGGWTTDYYWNSNGATITVSNSSTLPAAPTGLTATAGNAQVGLSWTASAGATTYNVYRGTSAGGEASTPIATGLSGTSYTNTGLTNGATYYYKVAAVNSAGTSPKSGEASATPQVSAPPAPTGLAATGGNAQVALTWAASTGASSYNVYRGTTSGGESSTALATGVVGTSFTDTGVANGSKYYYKVAAVNAGGISPKSNEASATPQVSAPPAPTGLAATGGNAQVTLSWTASAGATSYKVYRGTSSGGESSTALATGITGTTYTDKSVTNGKKYYYKVAAVNAGGASAKSNEASATPQVAAPSTPTGLIAVGQNGRVMLSWMPASSATSYNVYRSTVSGAEGAVPVAKGIKSTQYTNSNLTKGTTYYYRIAAVNAGGTSPQSAEAAATP